MFASKHWQFDKLKNRIDQELTSWIEDTQNTIAKLQGKVSYQFFPLPITHYRPQRIL